MLYIIKENRIVNRLVNSIFPLKRVGMNDSKVNNKICTYIKRFTKVFKVLKRFVIITEILDRLNSFVKPAFHEHYIMINIHIKELNQYFQLDTSTIGSAGFVQKPCFQDTPVKIILYIC